MRWFVSASAFPVQRSLNSDMLPMGISIAIGDVLEAEGPAGGCATACPIWRSVDAELRAAVRREFETKEDAPRVTMASTLEAARSIMEGAAPTVILLEERAVTVEPEGPMGKMPRLSSVVSTLALHAPVVVIGAAHHHGELTGLVAAGDADFVAHGGQSLPLALERVERRLQHAQRVASKAKELVAVTETANGDALGEILRHELNNPLTGILGNAELLLAEVQRKNDGQLPQRGQQRLETIAALAVRLRETVRRLSEHWETRQP
jgi:signal transduction histidine kinase